MTQLIAKLKILEKFHNLQPLSLESEDALLKNLKLEIFRRNQVLLAEGDHCGQIYFVETGCLKSYMYKDGKEVNLGFCIEDNFTTNLKSLRDGSSSEYYIKACQVSAVWTIAKKNMIDLYERSHQICNLGRLLLEQLLIEQETHSNLFKMNSPAERYNFICKNSPELLQKVSLTQLSSFLGMSRESLSRLRRSW